jgi:hypothetical protein
MAASSGMNLVSPKQYCRISTLTDLQSFFEQNKDKLEFVLYIGNEEKTSHPRLKLLEAYYKLLTQHILQKNMFGGSQVIKNVVMKLNTKTFGTYF